MPKSAIKARTRSTSRADKASHEIRTAKRAVGRPPRAPGLERRQIIVDATLLAEAMRASGLGQSDVVNKALAEFVQNTSIIEGLNSIAGAFPDWPGHGEEIDDGAASHWDPGTR